MGAALPRLLFGLAHDRGIEREEVVDAARQRGAIRIELADRLERRPRLRELIDVGGSRLREGGE